MEKLLHRFHLKGEWRYGFYLPKDNIATEAGGGDGVMDDTPEVKAI